MRKSLKLSALLPADRPVCVLAGSGVSLDYPSCQPTGYQFTKTLLSHILPGDRQELIVRLCNFQESKTFLRFEQLMEILQKWDTELSLLNRYAAAADPNTNHIALANLVRTGSAVFTTNFDNLLEYGLESVGIPKSAISPRIWKSDWVTAASANKFAVWKLHGSLTDFRTGADCRASLRATLAQITQHKRETFTLESWKAERFAEYLRTADLVVVGYSGLDDFDVLPTLRSIDSDKRVIWVNHDGNRRLNRARIARVLDLQGSDTGAHIAQVKRIAESARADDAVFHVDVHTREFIQWLSHRLSSEKVRGESKCRCPEYTFDLPNALNFTSSMRHYVAGEILSHFDPIESEKSLRAALKSIPDKTDREQIAEIRNMIGRQLEAQFHRIVEPGLNIRRKQIWEAAMSEYETALKAIRITPSSELRATILNNIGQLHSFVPEPAQLEKAISYYEKALKIAINARNLEHQALSLNNIASTQYRLQNREVAVDACRRACEIDRELGDIGHLGTHLGNLGVFLIQIDAEESLRCLSTALQIEQELGKIAAQANIHHSIGQLHEVEGRLAEALASYKCANSTMRLDKKSPSLAVELSESLERVRSKMHRNTESENTRPDNNQQAPACIDHSRIEEILALVPASDAIADEQITNVVISCYRQINPDLHRRMEETGHWIGLKVGYGIAPPDPEHGMYGAAYQQASAYVAQGKTVLVQGGFEISKEDSSTRQPSEIWLLTVAKTPNGQKPGVGFVVQGALAPEDS